MRKILPILLAFQAICFAQPTGGIVLSDITLIDGTGRAPTHHVSILIRDGKIAQIVRRGGKWPPDAEVLHLTGKAVMPGIINGHGHVGLVEGMKVSGANYTPQNIERQLRQYERYGVTTVISLGMNQDLLYGLRAAQGKGDLGGATILTADRGMGIPGGVPPVNVGPSQVYRPTSPEEARKDVNEMAARDPDLIKFWVDDNLGKLPTPDPAIYAAAIDETHKQHLLIAAHVYYLPDAKRLLQDGVDILAHSIRDQPLDSETISLIKNNHVYYIPTLQLEESFFGYADHPVWMDTEFFKNAESTALAETLNSTAYADNIKSDKTTSVHKQALETAMLNLRKLRRAHALIAFGTDSGANPYRIPGFAEHRELQLMVQAGLTPVEAIHCATAVNAKMLHIDDKIGTITVGKQADLLVLDADPSRNIANTEKIAMVFHAGKRITKSGNQ